jgi:hypothetical protein
VSVLWARATVAAMQHTAPAHPHMRMSEVMKLQLS